VSSTAEWPGLEPVGGEFICTHAAGAQGEQDSFSFLSYLPPSPVDVRYIVRDTGASCAHADSRTSLLVNSRTPRLYNRCVSRKRPERSLIQDLTDLLRDTRGADGIGGLVTYHLQSAAIDPAPSRQTR